MLDCAIGGMPTPTTAWTFNGETLVTNGNTFLESSNTYSRVTLMEAVATQFGTYKITVENKVGSSAEAVFTVTVKGQFSRFLCINDFASLLCSVPLTKENHQILFMKSSCRGNIVNKQIYVYIVTKITRLK